jgi:RNA polymerase sigma-70 factor (ECF subfamily)
MIINRLRFKRCNLFLPTNRVNIERATVAVYGENKEQILVKQLLKKKKQPGKSFWSLFRNLTYVCSRYIAEKEDVHDVLQNSFIKCSAR